ncbi:fungal hydrophobin [Ganoderma leucocontextum]|nr:fungal hydrophobin [Ganoderma leucocontextum]
MKFSYAVAAVIAAAASVQATETNGQRMARGLKPSPPRNTHRRASRTNNEARGATPSGTPSGGDYNCNTGSVQCCNQVSKANDNIVSTILGLIGLGGTAGDVLVGLQCSPLSVVGIGSASSCSQRPVCCENNSQGGLVSIGCIPITL